MQKPNMQEQAKGIKPKTTLSNQRNTSPMKSPKGSLMSYKPTLFLTTNYITKFTSNIALIQGIKTKRTPPN